MIDPKTLLLTAAMGLGAISLAQEPAPANPAPGASPPAAGSQQPAEQPAETAKAKTVAQYIAELGSSSYRTRLAAERALREMGKDAVPALKQAVANADDPEVQWRARRVLRQVEQGGGGGLVERESTRGGDEPEVEAAEAAPPSRGARPGRGRLQPRAGQDPADADPMRDQFESLFERFERDFGIDIPRARFFEDGFFRDLREQMQGAGGRSQGMSVQIGPDGAVHVEVQERNDKGEVEKKVYDAPDLETFQRQYPGVLQQNGLRMGLSPLGGGFDWQGSPFLQRGFRFGPGLVPMDPQGAPEHIELEPMQTEVSAPVPPPAGRRLGIAIQPEIPAAVRTYLELADGTGLMVESVQDGSLAAALGLQKGDIVTRIGEHAIGSPQDVQDALGPIEKGAEVKVTFVRRGVERTATAAKTEAAAPAAKTEPKSGRLQPRQGGSIR
ncbi:MAG: PDZ domain-containing protein [Planctomycetes bacterium]|jgi:hypothetical protein|nr:PDZ domain-containing protein [Planctomycetota bacterium]